MDCDADIVNTIYAQEEQVMRDTNTYGSKLLTVGEVADILTLKPSTIRKMILQRRIDVVRPSVRAVRIAERAVHRILEKGYSRAISNHADGSE